MPVGSRLAASDEEWDLPLISSFSETNHATEGDWKGVPREKRLHMLDMLSKMEADLSEEPSPSAAPKN